MTKNDCDIQGCNNEAKNVCNASGCTNVMCPDHTHMKNGIIICEDCYNV
jgi:hypothetical protein